MIMTVTRVIFLLEELTQEEDNTMKRKSPGCICL